MSNPHNLIRRSFERQKKVNPKLSLRSLAESVKVSPGFLSKVFSGQKSLTIPLLKKLSVQLKLDILQQDQIRLHLQESVLRKKFGPQKRSSRTVLRPLESMQDTVLMTAEAEWLLKKWYYLAILDLITCDNFSEDPAWIAKRLGISKSEGQQALKSLELYGFIKRNAAGKAQKVHNKLRFPTKFSKEIIRDFHSAQMKQAMEHMRTCKEQSDFDRRLITSLTVATNPKTLEQVKSILHQALYEASELLGDGPCTEVYQINLQLFPHTGKSRE